MERQILSVIANTLDFEIEEIYPEAALRNDLIINSLDYREVIIALEEEFLVEIPDEKAEEFETIRDIIEYIKKERKYYE